MVYTEVKIRYEPCTSFILIFKVNIVIPENICDDIVLNADVIMRLEGLCVQHFVKVEGNWLSLSFIVAQWRHVAKLNLGLQVKAGAWRHEAITWTNIALSKTESSGIHSSEIFTY